MKKVILILSTILMLSSCTVMLGPQNEKNIQMLELGMTKQEVINIMGKNYYLESKSLVPDGKLEVLRFRYPPEYLVYFINGNLTEFHRYIPPTSIQQNVNVVKDESDK